MPRLGHKKSRLGCRQCKARHVKCDELKPCSNCARHGVTCSLLTWDPNIPQLSASASSAGTTPRRTNQPPHERPIAGSTSSSTPPSRLDYTSGQPTAGPRVPRAVSSVSEGSSSDSQSDLYPFLSKFIHRAEITQADIWLRDLELLHYWTTEAYDELSQRDDMRHTWRVDAPKHAVKHPFFMHEILAFAAFHRAHKEQNEQRREYYTFGVHHQDLAIRGVRERLHNVTPHEAAAIVATSTLLTLSVFASSGFEAECAATDTPQDAVDGILNCFYLMQGMGNVLAMAQATVRESFLAPMFKDPVEVIPSQPMLEELMQHIPTLTDFIRGKRDLPEDERKLYLKIVAFFQPVLGMSLPPKVDNRELRFLFFWPLHLDAEYMSFVRQRQPGALVILMYYTTILLASEPRYWFLDGWGRRLMQSCYDAVDQSWMSAIQWPLSFLSQNATWDLFANLSQRQQILGLHGGIVYTQQQPVVIPHRKTPPGPFTSAEESTNSYSEQASTLRFEEEEQKPVVRMGSSSVGQASSPDANR